MNNDEHREPTPPATADARHDPVPSRPLAAFSSADAAVSHGLAVEPADDDNPSKEGTLSEQKSGKIVRLKNGSSIEAERGWDLLQRLRTLLEDEPQHFQTLLALVRGDAGNVDSKSIRFLIKYVFLRPDGSLDPGLRDVLLSGYRVAVTGEGPVMANPFQLADVREVQALESEEDERREARWRKLVDRFREEDDRGHRR